MLQEPTQTLPVPPVPPVPPTPGPGTVVVQTPFPPNMPPWVTLPPAVTLLVALGFFAACAVVLYPLARAIARRLEGRGGADPAIRSELDQLRHRLEDVEGVHQRMLELEERVDFTERMLATQRRESERLPGG